MVFVQGCYHGKGLGMDFHEIWKDLFIGVVVGLVLMYQQRKINKFDDLEQRLSDLDKESVKWAEHERDIERIEDRHDKALEKVIDKLDSMQTEMNASITNIYKILVERDK